MALRNAFDLVATEGTLRQILRAVTFSKTSTDAMRVNIEGANTQMAVSVFTRNGNFGVNGNSETWYSGSAWNAVDGREQYFSMTQQVMQMTRNRWTIT